MGFDHPVVLDPTAGGGSIPFEAARLGLSVVANDLNPVAWLILKATVEFPFRFGKPLLDRYRELAARFKQLAEPRFEGIFPREAPGVTIDAYLWARTVTCPYCGGLIPLSPNWKLDGSGAGVRLIPQLTEPRRCSFEIVTKAASHSPGTVKDGAGLCPFPDCGRIVDGDEIKRQAQAGAMGQQLYAVVYKQKTKVGVTKGKAPKDKYKSIRGFRAPRPEDDVSELVDAALAAKMPEWKARNVVPDEEILPGQKTDEPRRSGMLHWCDMFAPRQLLGHCTSSDVYHDLIDELGKTGGGEITDIDRAALSYLAFSLDKMLNYNAYMVRWHSNRGVVAGVFDRHDFSFKWSFAEMAPAITGLGYDWTIEQTGKCLKELMELVKAGGDNKSLFQNANRESETCILQGSGDSLSLADGSVDCVVMDPPYYDNVMYAELADFFYVWLKRTAGLVFPEAFADYLTDKDREAVANPAKFKGQKGGAKNLAGRDYQERMAAIFREARRVIKPHGVMTVMFTHKASGAWDALAMGLVQAGFVITASWPINTEAEGSLHIKEKSAAKSTIFLVCRPREERPAEGDVVYWEEVEPKVAAAVRERVADFQKAGIGGVDLYLASFGPALQVFSESWPLQRGRPRQQAKADKLFDDEVWDPYAVRPEDALDAARREVKRWRMEQLATVKRQHHLDALTEWFVLAWDAFRAPRFPSDEALKLARVVGLDFDAQVKNVVCEIKGSDVVLWDSKARQAKGKLGPVSENCMLDTLHQAAAIARDRNTGAARNVLELAGLLEDGTLMTALEALLNVLPAVGGADRGKKLDPSLAAASSDFEALEKLRRLAFAETVPEPKQKTLFVVEEVAEDDTVED